MASQDSFYRFSNDGVTFSSQNSAQLRKIYLPLCGPQSDSLKSAITPFLSGDIKIDKNHYLTQPVSREDLHRETRQFFIYINEKKIISLAQSTPTERSSLEIGQLWHKLTKTYKSVGLEVEALNFIPVNGENVELMRVKIKNISKKKIKVTPTAAIPLFARALSNKHDHEHVTALLNRTKQLATGVLVEPTMLFNEEGHKSCDSVYFVFGVDEKGNAPVGTFPTLESFCGEGGQMSLPEAVLKNKKPLKLPLEMIQGKEAMGALRFKEEFIAPGKLREYFLVMGITNNAASAEKIFKAFHLPSQFDKSLNDNKKFWQEKSSSIQFKTGDARFDSWMAWVTLQPVWRRIFGNSFLPDHDYGKGGKGWRDLWQDLLSLILIEPENVRENLINNFSGVRIDGSNATIIGSLPGEFIADRNTITRVWMDHGAWPLLTLLLYINQTGDGDILFEEAAYFRDAQMTRTFEKDWSWGPSYGNKLKTRYGQVYKGTVLEHLLLQNLIQFFNVGEHNITRLENADWNDGLDMAFHRGESAAFMSFYGGNLLLLADLLEKLTQQNGVKHVRLAMEIMILLDSLTENKCDYDNAAAKRKLLFEIYCKSVQPELSGEQLDVDPMKIAMDLRKKGNWIFEHIRKHEKVSVKVGQKHYHWFNGYYDNKAQRVEGDKPNGVRMTLTGQVFPIMSGLANAEDTKDVFEAVSHFLRDKKLGGYRLNTDFGVRHYFDLGRAFGFAYGTKENGAFFSHMTVMYAYALYKQGFVREGYEVLNSIYKMCFDIKRSKIYPGIPEYFDSEGRGMYPFLTGSASWLVLTQLTQVFGVRGEWGDLVLEPKLVKQQFDNKGNARITCHFAGKKLTIVYQNPQKLDFGSYAIQGIAIGKGTTQFSGDLPLKTAIKRAQIQSLPAVCDVYITLASAHAAI